MKYFHYDAFGTEIETNEQFPNRIRYTGQQYDEFTEQYYLRARYYNPVLGRFMQEDVYQGDGLNLYTYCDNNPVMYSDPSGYAKQKCGQSGDIDEGMGDAEPNNNSNGQEGDSKTVITPEMEEKILFGQRKNPEKNELIGGHSPDINNSNPNYAVEVLQINPDGTQKVKFVTQYADGNLSNIKTSTLFPDDWSNDKIINSIMTVGDSSPIGVRYSDGAMLYRDIIDGVQIEVIKIGDTVTSGYPTGGLQTGLLSGFSSLK